jgi:hypothetical protein
MAAAAAVGPLQQIYINAGIIDLNKIMRGKNLSFSFCTFTDVINTKNKDSDAKTILSFKSFRRKCVFALEPYQLHLMLNDNHRQILWPAADQGYTDSELRYFLEEACTGAALDIVTSCPENEGHSSWLALKAHDVLYIPVIQGPIKEWIKDDFKFKHNEEPDLKLRTFNKLVDWYNDMSPAAGVVAGGAGARISETDMKQHVIEACGGASNPLSVFSPLIDWTITNKREYDNLPVETFCERICYLYAKKNNNNNKNENNKQLTVIQQRTQITPLARKTIFQRLLTLSPI